MSKSTMIAVERFETSPEQETAIEAATSKAGEGSTVFAGKSRIHGIGHSTMIQWGTRPEGMSGATCTRTRWRASGLSQ